MYLFQGLHDIKMEVSKLVQVIKEGQRDPPKTVVAPANNDDLKRILASLPTEIAKALPPPQQQQQQQQQPQGRTIGIQELQEALAHQTTLLQMSGLGLFGPPRPGFPQQPIPQMPPQHPQPQLQHPPPPQQQHQTQQPQVNKLSSLEVFYANKKEIISQNCKKKNLPKIKTFKLDPKRTH